MNTETILTFDLPAIVASDLASSQYAKKLKERTAAIRQHKKMLKKEQKINDLRTDCFNGKISIKECNEQIAKLTKLKPLTKAQKKAAIERKEREVIAERKQLMAELEKLTAKLDSGGIDDWYYHEKSRILIEMCERCKSL